MAYKRRIQEGLDSALLIDPASGKRIFCVNRGTAYLPEFRSGELIATGDGRTVACECHQNPQAGRPGCATKGADACACPCHFWILYVSKRTLDYAVGLAGLQPPHRHIEKDDMPAPGRELNTEKMLFLDWAPVAVPRNT